jgi:O-antigen/teichoic acid export membrane protein
VSLKHKTFASVRWTSFSALARAVLQIGQVAVLARLLAPADYGLMAIVSVVLSFAGQFSDMGVNAAFMQRMDVSLNERSSLFWFNVTLSCVLTLAAIALSPLFAWFYADPRLAPLMMLSASTFVIGALGQQVRMKAEKELNFRPVVLIELSAALLGFASALFSAFLGLGVYALVTGAVLGTLCSTILSWLFLACGWRPMWRLQWADVRPYLRFGGAMMTNGLINQINMTIDLLLSGRLLGATQLGFYSVPRNLVLQIQFMVNPIITRVGFPLIAQVQHDLPRVRSIYLQTMNMTASINGPIYIGLAFFSADIVQVLFGEKWEAAAPLLRILAIWGLFRSLGNPVGSLLMGMGRAGLSLKWNIGMLFVVPPAIWLGSYYGSDGLAWSMLGLMVGLFVPGWYFMVRPVCGASLVEYAVISLRPFLLALISIISAYWLADQFTGAIFRLIVGLAVAAPIYIGMSYKLNSSWFKALQTFVHLTKDKKTVA